MKTQDITTIDPELLLQELRARESRELAQGRVAAMPCGCGAPAVSKRGIGGESEAVAGLEAVETRDIVTALTRPTEGYLRHR